MSGSGKTDTGQALSQALHAPFIDADDLHAPEAKQAMAMGIPLSDADRAPWLERVRSTVDALCENEQSDTIVVACSALRKAYRDVLRDTHMATVLFVYLAVERPLLEARLAARQGHFMQASLLSSQLATLESPGGEPLTLTVHVKRDTSLALVVALSQTWLSKTTGL